MSGSDYFIEPLTQREVEILELLAEGLSNREIAQRLVIAEGTVKWYNKQIFSKLNVNNRKQAVIEAKRAGLLQSVQALSTVQPKTIKHNLPSQLTSFIGREHEITEVKQLLGMTRLLTLTGPPGTGKTRLGIRVAKDVLNEFNDGAYLIELAPISDPELVLSTITQVFDLRETAEQPLIKTLKNYLREMHILLLIDNFEQVIEAAPLVGELLSACPSVKALVTSREALRIYGEQEYTVPPLALPDLGLKEPLHVLSHYEAVDLFSQRSRAVNPGFRLSEENAISIAEICIRLDGLPLAIELAAARSKLLSPETIRARLEKRLITLKGGPRDLPTRLQTLRAAVDWSYDLLDEQEKALFARLAVFQGGRSEEAVESICGPGLEIDVSEGLESLLNKSLLWQEAGLDGEPRFVMLEMIHEYARERLEESGEAGYLKKRHAEHFLELAELAAPEMRSAGYVYWSQRLRYEHNNLRTALGWAFDSGDAELGLRMATALRDFWAYEGHSAEGIVWIKKALEKAKNASLAFHSRALNAAGWLSFELGDHVNGKNYNSQALSGFRELGDKENTAWALIFLSGHFLALTDGLNEAITMCEEGLAIFRSLDDKPGIIFAFNVLGELFRLDGDYERAGQAYEESLAIAREQDDKLRQAIPLTNLGYVAIQAGDINRAEATILEGISLLLDLENTRYLPQDLAMLAGPIAAQGNAVKAARLLGASEALLEKMGLCLQVGEEFEIGRYMQSAHDQLDEVTFKAAWSEGRAMSLEEAIAYAFEDFD